MMFFSALLLKNSNGSTVLFIVVPFELNRKMMLGGGQLKGNSTATVDTEA
jgi:hypothetical protein